MQHFGAKVVGNKTYGKNVLCRNQKIDNLEVQVPKFVYIIENIELEKYDVDYRLNNVNNLSKNEIIQYCKEICF